jgi:hypothetical protein
MTKNPAFRRGFPSDYKRLALLLLAALLSALLTTLLAALARILLVLLAALLLVLLTALLLVLVVGIVCHGVCTPWSEPPHESPTRCFRLRSRNFHRFCITQRGAKLENTMRGFVVRLRFKLGSAAG